MKKKTVITTETREVWVIRRQLDSNQESGQESDVEAVPTPLNPRDRSLAVPPEQPQPDAPSENE